MLFQQHKTPSEAGDESTVFFAHLLADCANFTGPVKGGQGQYKAMWFIALKRKSTLKSHFAVPLILNGKSTL